MDDPWATEITCASPSAATVAAWATCCAGRIAARRLRIARPRVNEVLRRAGQRSWPTSSPSHRCTGRQ
jgi:hypothetical protein